jgi:hypothetical protein
MTGDGVFAGVEQPLDREGYRARLREMSDERLLKEGKAARAMNEPSFIPVRDVFRIKLFDCRVEWRRRHPKAVNE